MWLDAPESRYHREGRLHDMPSAEKALLIICWIMSGVKEGFVFGVDGQEDDEEAVGMVSDKAASAGAW